MKRIKQFYKIFLITIFLSSCRTSINNEYPIINSEENINENVNSEKKRMELKFSCGEDGISEYLDDGWIILKEDSQEKICTWKSVPASKDCDLEKDKGCKITKPDKIGEEKTYLLEK
ncbi:alpha-2-macroglobulin [Prochlorococcus marinus XMU1411]|uniref:alpha-2-macroglobulin n=1 Tax=Prochlorococcus marinus TaxID=1219 RepID=UPI001AD9D11A|nr:alpha-2-macroglobulin [Prochlorococcus marinus]MBO8243621.1 alpha-2-macroglobulin [Prochlorococcus marinus XMU1411]MBW3054728.1 alpha-2-macroglobulin [Prochlorococcus marinus str. MU1411]MCR8538315.1 alpha-2-macroglobulin [Prochlorococcus marinus CUG1430]